MYVVEEAASEDLSLPPLDQSRGEDVVPRRNRGRPAIEETEEEDNTVDDRVSSDRLQPFHIPNS